MGESKNSVKSGYVDLTKTGPLTYRELRRLNNNLPQESYENSMIPDNIEASTIASRIGKVNYTLQPTGLGESIYDPRVANQELIENLQDYRANSLPWYAKIGAGLAKGTILAGTTFLDGTVGLLVGAVEALNRGDASGLWDNEFSRALLEVNEWSEKALPNYYSYSELNDPWYEHIFSANFIGDKFIKNLGFSVGALYSGGVTSAGLKLTKLPLLIGAITKSTNAPKMVTSLVGSVTSAVNEGRIEALNNSKEWQNARILELDESWRQRLNEKYAPEILSIKEEYLAALDEYEATKGQLLRVLTSEGMALVDPASQKYLARKEAIDARRAALLGRMDAEWNNRANDKVYNSTIKKIEEDRLKMGNTDMLMNIPILTASNFVLFGKFYANGYKTARKATNVVKKAGIYEAAPSKAKAALAVTKGAISEGTEEITQKMASEISGDYYSTDVNNFYKAKTDRNSEIETLSWAKSFADGINKTVNDGSSWEEFFIGSLTGLLGIPKFRSAKNSEGKLLSPIVLEGGIYLHYKDYKEEQRRTLEVVDYLNSRVQDPEFLNYYLGLIRHNKYLNDMNKSAEDGDEFNFKNAEHALLVSDIIMFDNAGRLDDLITLIESAYDISDENLLSIVNNTTSSVLEGEKVKKVGPFVDSNGNPMYNTPKGKEEMIKKLTLNKEDILKTVEDYKKAKNDIDIKTGLLLSDSLLEELAWMKTLLANWAERAASMSGEVKEVMGLIIGNLDSFMRFLNDIMVEEGQKPGNLSERYNIADENIRLAKSTIDILSKIKNTNDSSLASILAMNPDFVEGLMKEVLYLDDTILNADLKEDIINKLEDIVKLGNASAIYNAKFKEYLVNPNSQLADHNKADQLASKRAQEETSATLKEKLSKADSIEKFRLILNEEEDASIRDSILKTMEEEGSEVAKNYKETTLYDMELKRALLSLGEDSLVILDALSLWLQLTKIAENLGLIANPNSVAINNELAFIEDSNGDVELASTRFQNARYALQMAMSKVNNDIKFKDRFSKEYKKPVNKPIKNKKNNESAPKLTTSTSVGSITSKEVEEENKELNKGVKTQRDLDLGLKGQRKYYRPVIPELHIEASKEGDFRPFDEVVAERESGVDFTGIYNYLRDNEAFNYVNAAKLKPGDTLGFMIDPEFNDHTIFIVDTRNNLIVGSIDESEVSISRYEGLEGLIKKIRDEYLASRLNVSSENTASKSITLEVVVDDNQVRVSRYTPGRVQKNKVIVESRSTDRDGVTKVKLKEVVISDSKKPSLEGRTIMGGGLRIPLSSDIIDWKRTASIGATKDGKKITPEDITSEDIIDTKETFMDILNPNHNSGDVILYASEIVYGLDGIIIARNDKGLSVFLNYDPLLKGSFEITSDSNPSIVLLENTPMNDPITIYSRELDHITLQSTIPITKEGRDLIKDILDKVETGSAITHEIQNLILSIISRYNDDPNQLSKVVSLESNVSKFFATPQVRVSKIMVGRIPYTSLERSLADIPGVSDGGTPPIFGIVKNGVLTTNSKLDDSLIIKPIDMSKKEGRLYLLIPNAAGTYSPAAVRVKHFNSLEFNLEDATVANTPMGKDISEAITRLATAMSLGDVSLAMKDLAYNIYMQDVMVTWFDAKAGSGIVISKRVRKPDGTYEMVTIDGLELIKEIKYSIYFLEHKKDIEVRGIKVDYEDADAVGVDKSLFALPRLTNDIRRDIINTIISFNLPLQVSTSEINKPGYNSRLIMSNTLTSNLREAKVIGNWFTTDYFDKDGNLLKAVNPASITPTPGGNSPVGGTEGVINGTKVSIGGTNYIVDLKSNTIIDENGKKRSFTSSDSALIDMAWALENFGDATESSVMTENKIITPKGKVLDRSTGRYIEGLEAQRIKDKINGVNKLKEINIARAKRIEAEIKENLLKVDKNRTDGDYYYILEEDGLYHPYSRVHKVLGDNWILSEKLKNALQNIKLKLSKLADNVAEFDKYLDLLADYYKLYSIDLSPFKGKVDAKTRDTIVNIIRDKMSGTNSQRALDAGTSIDTIIRQFFTLNTVPNRPDNISEEAFNQLITKLTEIKSNIELRGERFLTNNVVLFQRYPDGTRVAGEVDILSVDANGNYRIYDVKTSRYSFREFIDKYGHKVNYFKTKSNTLKMSSELYYTLQLSAYLNLFESLYGVKPVGLAILPYVLSYDSNSTVTSIVQEEGILVKYNPAVNVPLLSTFKPSQSSKSNQSSVLSIPSDPIFESSIETMNPVNRVLPENAFEDGGEVGYYEKDGKIYSGYLKKIGDIEVTLENLKVSYPIHVTKVRDRGLGREGEFGSTSEYIVVFPNGYALTIIKVGRSDKESFDKIMEALSANPQKVSTLSSEKTQIFNPRELEESDSKLYNDQSSSTSEGLRELKAILPSTGISSEDQLNVIETVLELATELSKENSLKDIVNKDIYDWLKEDRAMDLVADLFNPTTNSLIVLKLLPGYLRLSELFNREGVNQAIKKAIAHEAMNIIIDTNNNLYGSKLSSISDSSGATRAIQKESTVNKKAAKRTRHKLRVVDSTRPTWNKAKELTWLKKNIPLLSKLDRVKIVEGLINVANNGTTAWGMFSDGIMTLSDIAAEGTVYHEAFHVVFNTMMNDADRIVLLEEAQKSFGIKSYFDLEEDLAEAFREYVVSLETRSLGRRIIDFFKNLFAKITNWKYVKPTMDNYFRMINQGRYSRSNINISSNTNLSTKYRLVEEEINRTIERESRKFLDNFGITLRLVKLEYLGEMPLFDALNRVINFKNAKDITEGVGYAVAFMMLHNGTMLLLIAYKINETSSTFEKGIKKSLKKRGNYTLNASKLALKNEEVRTRILKEIGSDIASELRKLYNLEPLTSTPSTFIRKLWDIIKEFFNMLTPSARLKFDVIFNYTKDIANSIKLNDPSIIITRSTKPGTKSELYRVDIEKALRENPYEELIISKLNLEGMLLAGSASIALSGTVYRPVENPLHDLDFQAPSINTRELMDKLVDKLFSNNTHIRTIKNGNKFTETYLIMDRPFSTKKDPSGKTDKIIYDSITGEELGDYTGSELTLREGVKGKFLDFFLGIPKFSEPTIKVLNNKAYLLSDYRNAWDAKISWARTKDIWDYNRFISNDFNYSIVEKRKLQEKERIKDLLNSARIIWGHPAIGKTTYLERNQDILEWDQEVNPKRNKFFRELIDPNHEMDINSREYKDLRSLYMLEWKNHPEYIEFLIREWNNLKRRAERENKRIFASPLPLLELFSDEMDLIVNIPENSFLLRNTKRGGTPLGSIGWKLAINRVLTSIDQDKIVTTEKYFSDFIRDNLGVLWGTLTDKEIEQLSKKGWTEELFNRVSQEERDNAVECAGL